MRDFLFEIIIALWLMLPFMAIVALVDLRRLLTERRRFNEMYRIAHYGQLKGTKAGDCE